MLFEILYIQVDLIFKFANDFFLIKLCIFIIIRISVLYSSWARHDIFNKLLFQKLYWMNGNLTKIRVLFIKKVD